MTLPIDISALLHGKSAEWERLEFKASWNPLSTLHTLCAFANDFHNLGGGYLVIGAKERNGQPEMPPVGVAIREIDRIQKEILNLGNSAIQPPYHPILVPYEIEGRHILVLWAPGGQSRPYKARLSLAKGDKSFGWFIRKGSSTVRARGADEMELMALAATVPFDDRLNQHTRVEDLSRELIREFLAEVGSQLAVEEPGLGLATLGRQMNIVGGTTEAIFPLNVGLMFFNPEPHSFFPATQIDVVWFPDGAGGDKFTEKTFRGPLARMVREALDYIRRNYLDETVIKVPDQAEALRVANFPYEAIEEAVVNAVYHRSYEVREPVEVRISPADFIVLSYPGPDRSIRLDQLRTGQAVPRRYRNRRIGEFLKELDLTEGRATGIPKILRAMRQNGSPPPEFDFDEDHSYFQVRLPVHPEALTLEAGPGGHLMTDPVTDPVADPVAEQAFDPLIRLLLVIGDGERSPSEIQRRLNLKHRPTFRQNYLYPALEKGLIEMTRPDKPSSRLQQYRVTVKGLAWLDEKGPFRGEKLGYPNGSEE